MRENKGEVEGTQGARGGQGGRRGGWCGDVVEPGKQTLQLKWRGPCGNASAFTPPGPGQKAYGSPHHGWEYMNSFRWGLNFKCCCV